MRWTRKRLKAECFRVLRSPELRLRLGTLNDCRARLVERNGTAKVTVDPHQSSLIQGAVHECLHVILDPQLGQVFSTKEPIPSAWEAVMDTLEVLISEEILSTAAETDRWRKAIDAKLKA